jgi:hypothetical protein
MEHHEKRKHHRRYQSLFWPMILIGVGTAWLLVNIGIFTAENISVALQLWPLLLIVIGIDIIFGRTSASRGATVGLAFVGLMLAIMYIGPSMGLGGNVERNNTKFDIPFDGAETLTLNIEAGIDSVIINPLTDSNNLVETELWHFGDIDIEVNSNNGDKAVTIQQQDISFNFGLDLGHDENSGWTINVNPDIPLAVDFEGGVGHTQMDLSSFELTDLDMNMGIGALDITLPVPQHSYAVDINGGVGEVALNIPVETAVQIVASTGIGSIDLPTNLIQVDGEDELLGADGTWQTEGFDQADNRITINYDGGIGTLKIR